LKSWLTRLKQTTYNTTLMYNLRMMTAFAGTAFVPYFMGQQLMTIPLTLGVVAAGLSDIDDRFSVRILNLLYTYIGFFITAVGVYLLFPYPLLFALALIVSCIALILLGSLGRRYATISYGCLVAWVLMFYEWNVIFLVLMGCGLLSLACVHFLFKETLEPERRLKLNFQQVLSLYRTIFQDPSFRRPLYAGCFSGAVIRLHSSCAKTHSKLATMYKHSPKYSGGLRPIRSLIGP
jgi:hypothetical protein